MLALPDKDPGDVLDYQVSFADLIELGASMDDLHVTIEAASNSESPLALAATSSQPIANDDSPARLVNALFWLRGGTAGVKYTVKVDCSDNASGSPDRRFVRRCTVKVKPL